MADYSDIEFLAQQTDYISRLNTLRIRSQDQATEQENARSGEASLLARLTAIVAAAVQKTGLTANLDAAGFTLTNLPDATSAKHPATLSQVQSIAATGGSPAGILITDFNPGAALAHQFLRINAAGTAVVGGYGGYITKTANYTAIPLDNIAASTSGGGWTLTLPATPPHGTYVSAYDIDRSWGANNLVVARNGATIMTFAEDMTCRKNDGRFRLIYDSVADDWGLGA